MNDRDEFAKAAMGAIIIAQTSTDAGLRDAASLARSQNRSVAAWVAHAAYEQANAMLLERSTTDEAQPTDSK